MRWVDGVRLRAKKISVKSLREWVEVEGLTVDLRGEGRRWIGERWRKMG
jgi:hypothetical protein